MSLLLIASALCVLVAVAARPVLEFVRNRAESHR